MICSFDKVKNRALLQNVRFQEHSENKALVLLFANYQTKESTVLWGLRERYFIQKIVLFHTARHIYGINHDLLRLFFRKPSQCSGLFDYHSLSAVVFENAFNAVNPTNLSSSPRQVPYFPFGSRTNHPKPPKSSLLS